MKARMPTPVITGRPEPILQRELALLELLLADTELASLRRRLPLHPAITRYDTISAFLSRAIGFSYPEETSLALDVGSTLLDALLPSDSVTPEGILRSIGDKEVLQQLRQRAADPNQFHDRSPSSRSPPPSRSSALPSDLPCCAGSLVVTPPRDAGCLAPAQSCRSMRSTARDPAGPQRIGSASGARNVPAPAAAALLASDSSPYRLFLGRGRAVW